MSLWITFCITTIACLYLANKIFASPTPKQKPMEKEEASYEIPITVTDPITGIETKTFGHVIPHK
jgi:hypothetical protein